jgi:hypothetical protein
MAGPRCEDHPEYCRWLASPLARCEPPRKPDRGAIRAPEFQATLVRPSAGQTARAVGLVDAGEAFRFEKEIAYLPEFMPPPVEVDPDDARVTASRVLPDSWVDWWIAYLRLRGPRAPRVRTLYAPPLGQCPAPLVWSSQGWSRCVLPLPPPFSAIASAMADAVSPGGLPLRIIQGAGAQVRAAAEAMGLAPPLAAVGGPALLRRRPPLPPLPPWRPRGVRPEPPPRPQMPARTRPPLPPLIGRQRPPLPPPLPPPVTRQRPPLPPLPPGVLPADAIPASAELAAQAIRAVNAAAFTPIAGVLPVPAAPPWLVPAAPQLLEPAAPPVLDPGALVPGAPVAPAAPLWPAAVDIAPAADGRQGAVRVIAPVQAASLAPAALNEQRSRLRRKEESDALALARAKARENPSGGPAPVGDKKALAPLGGILANLRAEMEQRRIAIAGKSNKKVGSTPFVSVQRGGSPRSILTRPGSVGSAAFSQSTRRGGQAVQECLVDAAACGPRSARARGDAKEGLPPLEGCPPKPDVNSRLCYPASLRAGPWPYVLLAESGRIAAVASPWGHVRFLDREVDVPAAGLPLNSIVASGVNAAALHRLRSARPNGPEGSSGSDSSAAETDRLAAALARIPSCLPPLCAGGSGWDPVTGLCLRRALVAGAPGPRREREAEALGQSVEQLTPAARAAVAALDRQVRVGSRDPGWSLPPVFPASRIPPRLLPAPPRRPAAISPGVGPMIAAARVAPGKWPESPWARTPAPRPRPASSVSDEYWTFVRPAAHWLGFVRPAAHRLGGN